MSNISTIRRTIRLLKQPKEIIELRAKVRVGNKNVWYSGYYDDHEKAARDADELGFPCYIIINKIGPGKEVTNTLEPGKSGHLTKAQDIAWRTTIYIDIDPVRESDTPSTDEQHNIAIESARKINEEVFKNKGAVGSSGNGGCVFIRIDLPPDSPLVKRLLKALAEKYDTDDVKVDTTVANPARIARLLGTDNCKGGKVGRESCIIDTPQAPRMAPVYRKKDNSDENGEIIGEKIVEGETVDAPLEIITEKELEAFAEPLKKQSEKKREARRIQRQVTSLSFGNTYDEQVDFFHGFLKSNNILYTHKKDFDPSGKVLCDWFHFPCQLRPDQDDAQNWIVDHPERGPSGGCHHRKCREAGLIDILHAIDPSIAARASKAFDDPYRLASGFLNSRPPMVFWQGVPYFYRNGTYLEDSEASVKAALSRYIEKEFNKLKFKTAPKVTRGLVGDVYAALIALTFDRKRDAPHWLTSDEDTYGWLLFNNGLIHVPTFVNGGADYRRDLTPDFFSLAKLPYDFNPDAPEPKNFLEYVKNEWPKPKVVKNERAKSEKPKNKKNPDPQLLIEEILGDILLPIEGLRVFYPFYGKPKAGKSTFVRVCEHLIGVQNRCALELAQLAKQFGLEGTIGKKLILVSEAGNVRDSSTIVENIKKISGNDAIEITRKFKTPLTLRLETRMVIVSNHHLRLDDPSGALFDRMVPLPFHRSVGDFAEEVDPNYFEKKLLPELPGILLLALRGWKRLHENNGRFTMPEICENMLNNLREGGPLVGSFVSEVCKLDPKLFTSYKDLWSAWDRYCRENDCSPGEEDTFRDSLLSVEPSLVRDRHGPKRARGFRGIKILKATESV